MFTPIALSKKNIAIGGGILLAWLIISSLLSSSDEAPTDTLTQDLTSEKRKLQVKESIQLLNIKDPGLLKCIEMAASDKVNVQPGSAGGIDRASELKHLYCRHMGIISLEGIDRLTDLEFLDISSNKVRDIKPLAYNSALKSLHLAKNPIEDIDVLAKLNHLEKVSLPKLNNIRCDAIIKILGRIKSDLRATDCLEDNVVQKATPSELHTPAEVDRIKEAPRLSREEEAEIMEYQRHLRQKKFE